MSQTIRLLKGGRIFVQSASSEISDEADLFSEPLVAGLSFPAVHPTNISRGSGHVHGDVAPREISHPANKPPPPRKPGISILSAVPISTFRN